jgi:AGCS family alanine or glycine:cation symporter
MFILYTSAMIWIIGCNISNFFPTLSLIWHSAFEPDALGTGFMSGSLLQALRWGLAKGYTSNESGMGTATVPHSMAEAHNSIDQGILSIVSVFSNGVLSILSGLAILMTGMHTEYGIESITIITRLFSDYFPLIGPFILLLSATLFVISTLIGNTYNGSQFFSYSLGKRGIYLYYTACALSIFLSSMFRLDLVQDVVDFVAIPVMLIHVLALITLAFTHGTDLEQHAPK